MTSKSFKITGIVRDKSAGQGLSGLRVEAWDKDLVFNDLLGNAITDEQGHFLIEFTEEHYSEIIFDRTPDLFFKVFDQNNTLITSTENSVLWNVKTGESPMTIEVDVPAQIPNGNTSASFIVKGQIKQADGSPLSNALVRAFDKDLRHEQVLKEFGE